MSWSENLFVAVTSGVAVPTLLAGGRAAWTRRRVPTALVKTVRRESYLGEVLAESKRPGVSGLDVLAPRLAPARERPLVGEIQSAWKQINARGKVRVLTLDSDESLEAGAEHLRDDVEVRVSSREIGAESLSYHLFGGADQTAIINHHEGTRDQPVRLEGSAPAQVFRLHFDEAWRNGSPLESVIAKKIVDMARSHEVGPVLKALDEVARRLALDPKCVQKVLPHLAFQHSCSVIILVGLPGAGKSYVRRILSDELAALRIQSSSLTDYVYAYRDFLHELIKLAPAHVSSFEAHDGGAFVVHDEAALVPALRALAGAARKSMATREVTLVEFARAGTLGALEEFDDIRNSAHIVYLEAPRRVRAERLSRRARPPESFVAGGSVTLTISDDHLLPSSVERTLYDIDDVNRLAESPLWSDRVFRIQNDRDHEDARVRADVRALIEKVVTPYRQSAK